MNATAEKLLTVGQIAAELGQPVWRIQYLCRERGIEHVTKLGPLRGFDQAAVDQLRSELQRMRDDADNHRQP
jgi:hypothetical protein